MAPYGGLVVLRRRIAATSSCPRARLAAMFRALCLHPRHREACLPVTLAEVLAHFVS
jgi:hypothetical protein